MSDERPVGQFPARYVRAADRRRSAELAALFAANAKVEMFHNQGGIGHPVQALADAAAIGRTEEGLMHTHPARGWSHQTTCNAIMAVRGDSAARDTQFVVLNTVGSVRTAGRWQQGAAGAQGVVQSIEPGYYAPELRRIDGVWRITQRGSKHDLRCALPGA